MLNFIIIVLRYIYKVFKEINISFSTFFGMCIFFTSVTSNDNTSIDRNHMKKINRSNKNCKQKKPRFYDRTIKKNININISINTNGKVKKYNNKSDIS